MGTARTLLVLLGAALMGACATSEDPYADLPPLDLEKIKLSLNCPTDTTAVCHERQGQQVRCYCASRDGLRRILEPEE